MNIKRYTLPVVVAAGLHGALFLSSLFTNRVEAFERPVKNAPPPSIKVDDPFIEEIHLPKDEMPTTAQSAPKGEPRPESPEPRLPELPSPWAPPPPRRSITIHDHDVRTIGPIGDPNSISTTEIDGGTVFPPAKLDSAPHARVQRAPDYPMALKQQGIGGSVTVEFTVDTEGRVISVSAVRYTHSEFVEPALRAVRSWRFEPGRHQGRAVSFRMMIPIEFGITAEN